MASSQVFFPPRPVLWKREASGDGGSVRGMEEVETRESILSGEGATACEQVARREKLIVKLERHEAAHTGARTWWTILKDGKKISLVEARNLGLIRKLHSTDVCEKTHWSEYYEVIDTSIVFVKHRISNRGNYSRTLYKPEELRTDEPLPGRE